MRKGMLAMNRVKCLLGVALVAFAALDADAATWFNWKGGDGNWSDKSHWDEGRVPVSGDIVIQFKAGTAATIVMPNFVRFGTRLAMLSLTQIVAPRYRYFICPTKISKQ